MPVVAGTALIGHTLERQLQLQSAPAWTADPKHLAAAREATGYLGFECLLKYRPVLIDVADYITGKVPAMQEGYSGLQRDLDAGGMPSELFLQKPAAAALLKAVLKDSSCMVGNHQKGLLAQRSTLLSVKQELIDGSMLWNSLQPVCNQSAHEYGSCLRPVLQDIFQRAAEQLLAQLLGPAASPNQQQQQLQYLQSLLNDNLLQLQEPFIAAATELVVDWSEDGKSLPQLLNAQIKDLLEQVLVQVQATAMKIAAQAVYNTVRNSPGAQAADAVLQQEAGLDLETACHMLFSKHPGSGPAKWCERHLHDYERKLFWEDNACLIRQTLYLAKR